VGVIKFFIYPISGDISAVKIMPTVMWMGQSSVWEIGG